jgi:N-acetylmuramoyl-L-alanine amidase
LCGIARPGLALILSATLFLPQPAHTAGSVRHVPAHTTAPFSPYEKAEKLHEALIGRPQDERTRRDYERVLDAYRAVYHTDPASPKADASVSAVADILAEEGRSLDDEKILRDAIGQYEFLRREYPASRLCPNALLTEAAIYQQDLGERADAKAKYQEFLKAYPHNALADQARQGLKTIHNAEVAEKHGTHLPKSKVIVVEDGPLPEAKTAKAPEPPLSSKKTASSFPSSVNPPVKVATAQAPTRVAPQAAITLKSASTVSTVPPTTKSRAGKPPLVTSIRHWSTNVYTRVAIDLDTEVQYEAARVPNPDRIFFDLHGVKLSPELIGRSVEVTDDGYLKRIRAAQFSNDVTRIVLDVSDVSDYSAFLLPNPYRLIIDIHGRKPGSPAPAVNLADSSPAKSPSAAPPIKTPPPPTAVKTQPATGTASSRPQQATTPTAVPAQRQGSTTQAAATAIPPTNVSTQKNSTSLEEVASLSHQKNRVKATSHPTTAPISASVAGTSPAPDQRADATTTTSPSADSKAKKRSKTTASSGSLDSDALTNGTREAIPTSAGQRSLVRALGLKIGRIVVDAGHGGHDSGTLGPEGIEEKEVVLDVALRLGKILKQRLGADVIYTRDDDTFIPLETRTAIANKAQADLFISIHANSSQDPSARGVETYYLNFTASPDALEVAARENAVSDQSIHQLSDLVKKITLKDKIDESREFASDVQQNLFNGLEDGNRGMKDRGVKKAPFVVLIGANMPSILAEISFLTNPDDARELRDPNYRQRIAESLYRGVSKYVGGLSGVRLAQNTGRVAGD